MTLEEKIGYTFQNKTLLTQALTLAHGSKAAAYERLEFLGDRVLGLVIADLLYKKHPQEAEGDLAKRFTALVREETLAMLANILTLPDDLKTNEPELRRNQSILADVLEALMGAVYLDGGLKAAQNFITPLYADLISQKIQPPVDAKTPLQEWGHRHKLGLPTYTLVERTGPDHAPHFKVEVKMTGYDGVIGAGTSKRLAEQAAAEQFLKENNHDAT